MIKTKLGKLKDVKFGLCGYDNTQLGLSATISGEGWGVCVHRGAYGGERSPVALWTEIERTAALGEVAKFVGALLEEAKKTHVEQLNGVPVEATFENDQVLVGWRILTEVL